MRDIRRHTRTGRPLGQEALRRWLGWVGVTHVRRYHEHYRNRGGGHLYQGRFKSFPGAEDDYFLALCRYVEANALRAGLVERGDDWPGSGLWQRTQGAGASPLGAWPVTRPRDWLARVDRDMKQAQLDGIRVWVQRGRPLGTRAWVEKTVVRRGLEFTLRDAGRSRKAENPWYLLHAFAWEVPGVMIVPITWQRTKRSLALF